MNHSNPEAENNFQQSRSQDRRLTSFQNLKLGFRVIASLGIGATGTAGTVALENYSGRTALVQAAGCENPILALDYMHAQDVRKNPDSLTMTNESFVIPMDLPATFGPAEVLYKKNPDDPNEKAKSYPIELEMNRDHAKGKTTVKEEPNKGTSLYLEYTFLDDAKDPKTGLTPRRPLVLACNEPGYFSGGRASIPDTLNKVVNSSSITGLSKVGDRSYELASEFMKTYKRKPAFTPPGAKPDENLKALKANVAEAIASYKKIKAEEAKRFATDTTQKPDGDLQTKNKLVEELHAKNKQLEEEKKKLEAGSNPVPLAVATGVGGIGLTSVVAFILKRMKII